MKAVLTWATGSAILILASLTVSGLSEGSKGLAITLALLLCSGGLVAWICRKGA